MKTQSGFTLLEVLTAFTILALSLGILLEIYGRGARAAASARQYEQALWIAESRLAATVRQANNSPGQSQGQQAEFAWQVQVRPYELGTEVIALQEVEAQVSWRAGNKMQQIRLGTLRLAPGE